MSIYTEAQHTVIAQWLIGEHREDMSFFDAEDFGDYAGIFEAIKDTDEVDLLEVAKKSAHSMKDLTEIMRDSVSALYENCYQELKRHRIAKKVQMVTPENIEEAIREIEKELNTGNIGENEDWIMEYWSEVANRKNKESLYWGFDKLDRITGGIKGGELTTIAARPSVGKSAMVLQASMNFINQGAKVLYLPLEMTKTEIAERLYCSHTNIPHERLKTGELNETDLQEYQTYSNTLTKLKNDFVMLTRCRNIPQIKRAILRYEPDVLVVDQLSLLQGAKETQVREQYTYYTRTLKTIAAEFNIAILLVAQLRRSAETTEPKLSDLKESGSIEENSDNVIMIHRFDAETEMDAFIGIDTETVKPCEFIIGKQRNGETGIIYTVYQGNKFLFNEI